MLHRHPVTLQPKFTDQLFQAGRLRERIEGAGLSIEDQDE
jgi:hypothetical protein